MLSYESTSSTMSQQTVKLQLTDATRQTQCDITNVMTCLCLVSVYDTLTLVRSFISIISLVSLPLNTGDISTCLKMGKFNVFIYLFDWGLTSL